MPPDPDHTRPDGASDALVATTGRLTEALEYVERAVRDATTAGRRHVFEAELKERRRTRGHPEHTAHP